MYALVYYICMCIVMYMCYLESSGKEVGIDWYRYLPEVCSTDLSSTILTTLTIHLSNDKVNNE